MSDEVKTQAELDEQVKRESAKRTRRSFVVAAVAAAAGYKAYDWLNHGAAEDDLRVPFRRMLDWNADVARTVFHDHALAPTFAKEKAVDLRVNGNYGLKEELLLDSYRLQMVGVENAQAHPLYVKDVTAWEYEYAAKGIDAGHVTKEAPKMPAAFEKAFAEMNAKNGGKPPRGNEEAGMSDSTLEPGTGGLLLKLDDVTRLPRQEFVTEFKCIEGWSEIVHWGGFRLADLIEAYPPAKKPDGSVPQYVYMETPNGDYYCGYDLAVCRHPQSLLATEMSGRPLTQAHGAPLRLHMPTKYGYKQIKRIGLIAYTDMKPDDYWTKLGYDWYAGL